MSAPYYEDEWVTIHAGDCLDVLRSLPDASVDAVVTDPPYGLEFMGKEWDKFRADLGIERSARWAGDRSGGAGASLDPTDGIEAVRNLPSYGGQRPTTSRCLTCGKRDAFRNLHACGDTAKWVTEVVTPNTAPPAMLAFGEWVRQWSLEVYRVLKPGGHMLAFGGTRTWHRLACAVEDAGFEVRDSIAWLYGQGFPKSLNVSSALDAARCRCPAGEWTHGTGDPHPQTEHGLRDVPDADVPATEGTPRGAGALLLPSLSEPGAPAAGRPELRPAEDGRGEPRLEGRGHLPQGEGQLRGTEVRPLPAGVPGDGPSGRLHHGAPAGHGSVGRPDADADGVREPQEPRSPGQPAGELGALPDQRRSQAWGGWPVCERCSQPVIPDGLGTAAKPAFEPIVVARKPLAGTVAANVLAHGTGALNIDATRVGTDEDTARKPARVRDTSAPFGRGMEMGGNGSPLGRWPANVVLDESQAATLDEQSGERPGFSTQRDLRDSEPGSSWLGTRKGDTKAGEIREGFNDNGGASRFFYVAKADASERVRVDGIAHPTVKPLALMRWLVRLVTPPGGTVLEPFAGSGTTVEACLLEGFRCIAIEREADYLPLIVQRINRRRDPVAAVKAAGDDEGLFGLLDGEAS